MKKLKTFKVFNESQKGVWGVDTELSWNDWASNMQKELIGLLVKSMSIPNWGTLEMETERGLLCFAPGGGAMVSVDGNIDVKNVKISDILIEEYGCDITFDNGEKISVYDDTGGEVLEIWWEKPLDETKKSENIATYTYLSNCTNSFNKHGEGKYPELFVDEEHFFNSWEEAEEISAEEFWKHIDPHSKKYEFLKKAEKSKKYKPEYRYSEADDVYFIFVYEDTHYFFVDL